MLLPITKQLKAIASLAGTDNATYALGSVCHEVDGTLNVTDGVILLSVRDADFWQDNTTQTRLVINAQAIADAPLKGCMSTLDIQPKPQPFPIFADVLPQYTDENAHTFTLDAQRLIDLAKAIQKITNDKHARLKFQSLTSPDDRRKPVAIGYANAQGYLMPITF